MAQVHQEGVAMISKKQIIESWDLYAITDSSLVLPRSLPEVIEEILSAGVKVIQYREKKEDKPTKLRVARALKELTQKYDASLIINDDIDVAKEVGADGLHIGQGDMSPVEARQALGEEMIIGYSTHSPQQALEAQQSLPVDYIGVGPVFPTQTKKNAAPPVGIATVEWASKRLSIPFVAIGGINATTIESVIDAGAKIIAMVSAIMKTDSHYDTAKHYLELFHGTTVIEKG